MTLLIPENLDIESHMRENVKLLLNTNLCPDKLLYICDCIIRNRALHRKEINEKGNEWVLLNAELLSKVVHDYTDAIKFLITCKIIETDNYYIPGSKSRGYRFTAKYDGQRIVKSKINRYTVKKAIRKLSEWHIKEQKINTWGYSYLTKWWDVKRLRIDVDACQAWINQYEYYKKDQANSRYKYQKTRDKKIRQITNTCEDFKILVSKIDDGKYNLKFDDTAHRFFNNFTNLKKELRNFISYDGKELVSLDLKNSQPYLALKLFDRTFWQSQIEKEKISLKRLDDVIYNKIRQSKEYYNSIIMLVHSLENHDCKAFHDYEFYQRLVLAGGIYEFIQDNLQPIFPKRFFDRSATKREVLRIMYFDPAKADAPFYEPAKHFGQAFPVAATMFNSIKRVQYNFLPIILQKVESYIMIDLICKNLSMLDSSMPLFTIHDSIVTTHQYQGIVFNEMTNVLTQQIGFKPRIEIEPLTPFNLYTNESKVAFNKPNSIHF